MNLFNPGVSLFTMIDYRSTVSRYSYIWEFCKVVNSELGDYSYVGRSTNIVYAKIGNFCSISDNCAIGMGTHTLSNLSTSSIFTAARNGTRRRWVEKTIAEEYKTVIIGNDVWIGQRAMVMGGVTIGDGAVVGAGAIVTKDVPPYAIVGGIPAKVIKYRFDEPTIKTLLNSQWWNKSEEELKSIIGLFQKSVSEDIISKLP